MSTTALPSSATASAMRPSRSVQIAGRRPAKAGFSLGKYREVVVAVALFLIFDLGVLVLNFYISFQISEDATAINLAGRQRMLSQRTTKAIYAVEDRLAISGQQAEDGIELESAINLFDNTLRAFREGGTVAGGDGKPVTLEAVTTPRAKEAVAQTLAVWQPLLDKARTLLLPNPTAEQIKDAVAYARANNTQLLGRMNDLTSALEQDAADRAARLRLVQTIGIVLALLNFVFILFKFIRSLRRADQAAEEVANENREILESVREGLFLITPDLRVGTQIAKASHDLFGRPVHPGETLLDVLKPLVASKVLQDTHDYLDLLFAPHVKEQLVQSINPLSDVQINTLNRLDKTQVRHLSFAFNRSMADNQVTHLLVTVQDITERKQLEAALQTQKQSAQREFSLMLKALETDASELAEFVQRSEQDLLSINQDLRDLSFSSGQEHAQGVIKSVFQRIHAFKGEALTLGLEVLSTEAEKMEDLLQSLRNSDAPMQESLLELPIILERLLGKLSTFKDIAARLASSQTTAQRPQQSAPSTAPRWESEATQPMQLPVVEVAPSSRPVASAPPVSMPTPLHAQLSLLAAQIAKDTGKTVSLAADLQAFSQLPHGYQQPLKDIMIQLLRNAVVHGIEAPNHRLSAGKSTTGEVRIHLKASETEWQLSVRDDGAGLQLPRIRERLRRSGWYSDAQLQDLNDRQLLAHIFKSGFSTAEASQAPSSAISHAGRGVGLDVVQAQAKAIGAQLGLSSTPGQFTEFKLRIARGASA